MVQIRGGGFAAKGDTMHLLRCVVLYVLVVLAALAGCSQDEALSPITPDLNPYAMRTAMIGPSEIVVCMDVSDSMSTAELEQVVNAVTGCLSDPDLIPQDGTIAVATVVYGDTIATIFGRTPVTGDNLLNVIQPALTGLLNDRIVNGSAFDLSGALDAGRAILEAGSVLDRHALIIGSGAVNSSGAVEASCTALGGAGAMISAIAVGADAQGEAILAGCANATGGYFTGEGVTCGKALAYMLQVDIDLEPEEAERYRGETHTVSAAVFRGGDPVLYPVTGIAVVTTVIEGPHIARNDTSVTDESGMISWSYLGDGAPGTDLIVSTAKHPGTGLVMSDTVMVTWLNHPPVCDAGGPYTVDVFADTAQISLDANGSSDADGDSLRFTWTIDCEDGVWLDDEHAVSPTLMITGSCLCVDSFSVNLTVYDGYDSTSCVSTVHINDLRPPVIEVREDWLEIWPPNHKYHEITPEMMILSVADACGNPIDVSSGIVIEVRSDEPENGHGDGNKRDDMKVTCPNLVDLRAERMGPGNGRVYTIVYRYHTRNGVSGDAEAYVAVPHDSSGKEIVNDEGCGYSIVPDCKRRD